MPYFSYISMYHLYESLGWWRRGAHVKQIHVAEEWNEVRNRFESNPFELNDFGENFNHIDRTRT